jgi:putative transposase
MRHSPGQIIGKLREADRGLAEGKSNAEIGPAPGSDRVDDSRWRNQCGGLKGDDPNRLKELANENSRLKRIVADQTLDIDMLIARGKW